MRDNFRGYDEWKLRTPWDEADDMARRRQRAQDLEDRADDLRDREKYRDMNAEAEIAYESPDWDELGATDLIEAGELLTGRCHQCSAYLPCIHSNRKDQ